MLFSTDQTKNRHHFQFHFQNNWVVETQNKAIIEKKWQVQRPVPASIAFNEN